MAKILDINTNLQIPNKLFKDGSNLVSQVTDHASGIPFVQSDDAKKPVYNYDGYLEFDGVNDYIEIANEKLYTLGLTFTIDIWIYLKSTATQVIMSSDNGATNRGLQLSLISAVPILYMGSTSIASLNNALAISTWHNITYVANGVNIYSYLNGVLKNKQTINVPISTNGSKLRLGSRLANDFFANVNIKWLKFYDKNIIPLAETVIGTQVFTPKQPFPFCKRYKEDGNKKLFLSSRYLENAVINSSDEITSIKNEVDSTVYSSGGIKPKLINNSIYFPVSSTLSKVNTDYLDGIGSGDFFFGIWVDMRSVTGNNYLAYLEVKIYIYASGANIITQVGGQNTTIKIGATITDGFVYLTTVRKDGIVYAFYKGVLVGTNINTVDISQVNTNVKIGGIGGDFYVDEPDFTRGSIIDPTGYAVGDKVFEPPRRRGLDSEIIQFPIP